MASPHTYNGVIDWTSDAAFRATGSALSAGLAAAGLVQKSDTGQINWATVARASANNVAGYEIWALPDNSLYLKIEYGAGAAQAVPQLWLTVGTGSNGSGTITGQSTTRAIVSAVAAPSDTVTPRATRISVSNDHVSVLWGISARNSSGGGCMAVFVVGKDVDSSGNATTDGYMVVYMNGSNSTTSQSVRLKSPAITYPTSNYASIVGPVTTSTTDGNNLGYPVWHFQPDMRRFKWACSVITAELATGNSANLAMVGSTPITYISSGHLNANATTAPAALALAYI